MKRLLRKVGLLTAAVVMMSSGIAVADNAQPSHGWMRSAPNDDLVNVEAVGARTDDNLRRNQTLYWAIKSDNGSSGIVIDTSTTPPEENGCVVGTDCASAPLFISAPSAVICADGDLATIATGDTQFTLMICSDSSCTAETSVGMQSLVPGIVGECKEFSGPAQYDGFNVGSMWVYIKVTAGEAPSSGSTSLVWITGN